jgi:hypothetical protein
MEPSTADSSWISRLAIRVAFRKARQWLGFRAMRLSGVEFFPNREMLEHARKFDEQLAAADENRGDICYW